MHLIYFLGRMDPLVKRTVGVPEDVEVFCLNGEVSSRSLWFDLVRMLLMRY